MLRNKAGQTLAEFLAAYDASKYDRPSLACDTAAFTLVKSGGALKLAVLMIKRADHPFLGCYALPGGFINMDEDLPAAAARELFEETGVSGLTLRQFGAFGDPQRDPRTRLITVGYLSLAPMGSLFPKAGDDAAHAALFSISARLEAYSATSRVIRLTLSSKDNTLTARAKLRKDGLGWYPEGVCGRQAGDLAADHALVLFCALCALDALPPARTAKLLTKTCPAYAEEAQRALKRVLGEIAMTHNL